LYVVARVGRERFAFRVRALEEVLDAPDIGWVPRASDGLLGQIRYRDRSVAAYDAGWAFGVARDAGSGAAIIVRDGPRRLAIVVDDVEDLARVDQRSRRPVPAGTDADGVLDGVCIAEGDHAGLISLVRMDKLLARLTARDADDKGGTS
jgi:chemotaxis signal transduction protein